ncbi:ATP-grasp domain-containing protein [Selenomonas ruminis]|uniref:ATP-grasp domain-containing protein n=1 Tax=Selenomonas ruminis TaxID=2593411 RepID=A0A5D6W701_9FIRM|nr:ATP-grasp domain-containing protein [Selenomonas sp. mPRGC5]TYZ24063.1 ATP-grasp domain-containing protein [Selenomonas sp. mPRGC5]
MKKLLILGGSRYVIPVIEKAQAMGVHVITCDYLPNNIGHKYSDEYYNVSIVDKEAVLSLAKKINIDGIMSFATDPGVITAAYVAEKLNLPGCPYESVKILQNKDKFRDFLKKNNFNVPNARGYDSAENVIRDITEFDFPVIVKPVDSAGSKGVSRVDDLSGLQQAVELAFNNSLSKRIIIEAYLEKVGCSSDTDCFSVNDELVFASFDCQYFDANAVNPYTPSSYSWPSNMPVSAQKELRSELQRLINLLHLGTSIYNVETRVCTDGKAYIMEVSPRGGGNRLSEMLFMACGEDLIEANIRGALGLPIQKLRDPLYRGAWAEYIIHSNKKGKFKELIIDDKFAQNHVIECDLWVNLGDDVRDFTGANETIGTLVLKFDSIEETQQALKHMNRYVKVVVE